MGGPGVRLTPGSGFNKSFVIRLVLNSVSFGDVIFHEGLQIANSICQFGEFACWPDMVKSAATGHAPAR